MLGELEPESPLRLLEPDASRIRGRFRERLQRRRSPALSYRQEGGPSVEMQPSNVRLGQVQFAGQLAQIPRAGQRIFGISQ